MTDRYIKSFRSSGRQLMATESLSSEGESPNEIAEFEVWNDAGMTIFVGDGYNSRSIDLSPEMAQRLKRFLFKELP